MRHHSYFTTVLFAIVVAATLHPRPLIGATLVWDFEGRVAVENDPLQDRLYDQSGTLKFHLTTPAGGDTFDRFAEGSPSNPVRYDAISDETPITATPGANPLNEWLLRSDWGFNGVSHAKHGDGDTGELVSDPFFIDQTSSFTMDLGGGAGPNGIHLHDAENGSVIISESRGGGFVQQRDWTNAELQAAGVSGPTEVYLRVADATTGGWGNVSVDNIVVQNASLPEVPIIDSFTVSAQSVGAGTPVTLSWSVSDPTGGTPALAITPDAGDVTGQSSVVVNPIVTTTYTLNAENLNGGASAQLTITVDEPPVIDSFSASPAAIRLGQGTNLLWSVSGADTLTIDQGVGVVTGSNLRAVTPNVSTTYTLTASNGAGSSSAQVSVTVDRTPSINSFTIDPPNIDPGATITLSWEVDHATSLSIDQGIGDVTGLLSTQDTPASTRTYTLTATNADGTSTATASVIAGETLTITEFLAVNSGSYVDEDGDDSDWIEIHNTTGSDLDLAGWYLTDDAGDLTKWQFPSQVLGSGAYLVVFASGKDRAMSGSELHTSFSLRGSGEYLALVKPDGVSITRHYSPSYPSQEPNISYGLFGAQLAEGYFEPPTPGEPNGTGFAGFVGDTEFSIDRGFYEAPIQVEITSSTPGARIRYRIDGAPPSEDSGTAYTGPIEIDSTTTLRAIAFKAGFRPSNVDTHTYLFAADVKAQPDMDREVLDVPPYRDSIEADLKAIPALSLVLPNRSLFGPNGIYDNSGGRGMAWERELSVEFFSADGREEFQVDAGIRIHGADARGHQKKPFKLYFRSIYGPGRLRFPLFPGKVEEFDKLVLRGGGHEGWTSPYGSGTGAQSHSNTLLRDQFLRQTHGEMGHLSPRGRHVHLYLNGRYWGVYIIHERTDEEYGQSHLGGVEEDYDVIKTGGTVVDGNKSDWNAMMALANGGLDDDANYARILDYLDLDDFIDNMIVRIWSGDIDWLRSQNTIGETGDRNKNWYALRKTRGAEPSGWKFFVWDGELSMGKGHRSNRNVLFNLSDVDINDSPGRLYTKLREHPEFRLRFADRLQKHFFNDGAMTARSNQARWDALAAEIHHAMVAESARWGDAVRHPPYTRDAEWQSEVDWMSRTFMARRTNTVLDQFRAIDLYPDLDPPEIRVGGVPQHGGPVGNLPVSFTAPSSGAIYYTTNGADPRATALGSEPVVLVDEPAANVSVLVPSVANGGSSLNAAEWTTVSEPPNPAAWKSGTTGVGFESFAGAYDSLIALPVPEMSGNTASVYLRVPFTIPDQAALDGIGSLTLNMKYDSGFVAYLNGVRVAAQNEPAVLDWQSQATADRADRIAVVFEPFDLTAHKGVLQVGANLLAIHAMNDSAESNDMLVLPQLVSNGGSPTGISPSARLYTGAFSPVSSGLLRARTLDEDTWSALVEAPLLAGTPADATNLVVSEVHYHPLPPQTPAEERLGPERKDYEYLELMKIGDGPIDLSLVSFAAGLEFGFPLGTILPAGERIVLAGNSEAFMERYGFAPFGQFTGNLENDGETITMIAGDGSTIIRNFTFNDKHPWPESADGDGYSLVLIAPETNPDHNDPLNWRSSVALNGTPGGTDAVPFAGDPNGDDDGDGLGNFLEHALAGTSLTRPVPTPGLGSFDDGTGSQDDYLTITFQRNLAADDVIFRVEGSGDLITWQSGEAVAFVSRRNRGDGTALETWRSSTPIAEDPNQFLRVAVIGRPF